MNTSGWTTDLSEVEVQTAAATIFQPLVDTSALRDRMARAAGILRSLPELPANISLICEVPESDEHVVLPVGEGIVIGRHEDCDVSIPECTALSRQHFQVQVKHGMVLLKDLSSSNGTYVNDPNSPSVNMRYLRDGDFILAGGLAFLCVIPEEQ